MPQGDINARNMESGFSLVELIIALLVSMIVIIGAATILVNSWLTQQDVTSTTEATTRGQLMGSTIERAMRNAKGFQLTPSDDSAIELRVWTSLGGNRTCQAFQLDVGQARIASSTSTLPDPSSWGDWEVGVQRQGTSPFFRRIGATTVEYTFQLETTSAPVPFSGEAKMRTIVDPGETSPCWP